MNGFGRHDRTFGNYLRQLLKHVAASTMPLALIMTVALLLNDDDTIDFSLKLTIDTLDSLWLLALLPIGAVVVFMILAPMSYPVFKMLSGIRRSDI